MKTMIVTGGIARLPRFTTSTLRAFRPRAVGAYEDAVAPRPALFEVGAPGTGTVPSSDPLPGLSSARTP
ncbi:hypothetical protein [Serinicoccus sp. LYQ131]|uniref:hypothetical protein n=1 Tax=Serinicoccus sp. LYQ131 TaxID=3378797 RepID=UPI003853A2FF